MEQPKSSSRPSLDGVSHRTRPSRQPPKPTHDPLLEGPLPAPKGVFQASRTKAPRRRRRLRTRLAKFIPRTRKQIILSVVGVITLAFLALVAHFLITSCSVFICHDGESAVALQENVDPTKLRGEGDGRVNILLIGVGGSRHQAGDLSDSIMLVSLDPISKDVTMLSIPRDFYVSIPDYGHERINAAHAYGERYNYPGGGPALLKRTLSEILGVPIHYYVRADFNGFKAAVRALGGVDVDVKKAIYDTSYPAGETSGYEVFKLSAGKHFLDAETALKYARSRHGSSDFDRGQRQQRLLLAIKQKALSVGTLANPVRINSLLSAIGGNIKTDFRIEEISKLMSIAGQIQDTQVRHAVIDSSPKSYLAGTTINGASVLIPRAGLDNYSQIRLYVRKLLVDGFIKNEGAHIEILNSTSQANLANTVSDLLKSYGYNVQKVGNDSGDRHTMTKIYDYTNGAKPYTINYLERRFGVKAERRIPTSSDQAEIVIIIGSDYKVQ